MLFVIVFSALVVAFFHVISDSIDYHFYIYVSIKEIEFFSFYHYFYSFARRFNFFPHYLFFSTIKRLNSTLYDDDYIYYAFRTSILIFPNLHR